MNKKRLVGGEFLLDLVMISFVASVDTETFTDITNQEVINQLTNLKTYIRNPKSIKPVWVRLQDNDDYIVARGELSKDKDSNVFVIRVKFKDKLLTINVEFTQMLNEDNDPIDDYYIDLGDADYNLVSQNNLSSIVDNQGNPRFIEGDIPMKKISGITFTYSKWSLSGTHLLMVIAGDIANGTTLVDASQWFELALPQWIIEKLKILFGTQHIDMKSVIAYATDTSSQTINGCVLDKGIDKIYLNVYSTITFTSDRAFRLIFDYLIDTDAPVEEQGE